MNEVLHFKNLSFYSDQTPDTVTIQGKNFQKLMDLCFAHADLFSLHRCNWPGSNDGPLEQALRPFCLGEYRSYAAICISEYEKVWEKCYLYPATAETKSILLRYIPHLFGREPDTAPPGHAAYREKKYAAYYKACEAAEEQIDKYLDQDPDPDTDTFLAFSRKAYCEANTIWQRIFDPKDYYSDMEDPCFFRGGEMFFETITHEGECSAHIFSEAFGEKLRELGEWLDQPNGSRPSLFSLRNAEDLIWYGEKA